MAATPQVKIVCSCCEQRLDVTGLDPLTIIRCPTCGTKLHVPAPEPPRVRAIFNIVCSNCQQRLDVSDLAAHTVVRCPSCAMTLTVPARRKGNAAVVQAQPKPSSARRQPHPSPLRRYGGKVVALAACAACAFVIWHYRLAIFGTGQTISTLAPPTKSVQEPQAAELKAAADKALAAGRYEEALSGYRNAEEELLDSPAELAAVRCQIGAALYVLGKPAEARAAFQQAVPDGLRGLPNTINSGNFASAVAQVLLGVVKPEGAEQRFVRDMPPAWGLTHFYLGVQALGEGRFTDAVRWWEAYTKAPPQTSEPWIRGFQELARVMKDELAAVLSVMKSIAASRAEEKNDEASKNLVTLKDEIRNSSRRAFLLSRLDVIEQEIIRLAAVLAQDPALQERKRLAKEKQELDRLTKLRAQFVAETSLFPPAERNAASAIGTYEFAAAADAYLSAAERMTIPELRQVARERANLYRRLSHLKQQAIEAIPRTPYAKSSLVNRRGGRIAGRAVRADAQHIVFSHEHGEMPVAWRDLDPPSLLALLTHFAELAAAGDPGQRADNFVALAWLSKDLKRDNETVAYANAATQLSAEMKVSWNRYIAPLPEPAPLPGEKAVENSDLARLKIPPFMHAGGVSQALANPALPSLLDLTPLPAAK